MWQKAWCWLIQPMLIGMVLLGFFSSFVSVRAGTELTKPLKQPAIAVAQPAETMPVLWQVPDFTLTDQQGHILQSRDLQGTVWLASFIFTSCADVCPLITSQMAQLRDALSATGMLGTQVRLVSFTVDPNHDTPESLRQYAHQFDADNPQQWAFLTGKPEHLTNLLSEGFHIAVETRSGSEPMAAQPKHGQSTQRSSAHMSHTGDYAVAHSNRLMLVDRCGQVRAIHPALEPERFNQLIIDLRRVLQEAESFQSCLRPMES